jgi:hypothetical protein
MTSFTSSFLNAQKAYRFSFLGAFISLGLFGCGAGATNAEGSGGTSSVGGAVASGGDAPNSGGASTGGALAGGAATSGGSNTGGTNATGGNENPGNGGSSSGGTQASGGTSVGGGDGSGGGLGDAEMPLVYDVENTGADCPAPPAPPAFNALPEVENLPDPFLLTSGTRISSRDEWRCRRAEISSQMQHWGSGPKGAPPSEVTSTFSGNKLTVVISQSGASITLSATLTVPSGSGPFPLIIGMNTATGSLPANIFTSRGIATLAFQSSQLVPNGFDVPRGAGTYFTMYPDDNAGAMIEWAWGVSRIIDGLYATADQNKVDLKHIGVTGCSYQGKMSLYAAAFDERIALAIPQESGGGGEASWRFMATQTGTEDLEAAQGTAWYAKNLKQFKNADASKLPFDQHELVAMVAPRAILVVSNTAIDRLGSQAGYVSMKAATELYKGLGIADRIGFTQTNASNHCTFPSSQTGDVEAFVEEFLLGNTEANTNIAKGPYNTNLTEWVTWTTPTLQ